MEGIILSYLHLNQLYRVESDVVFKKSIQQMKKINLSGINKGIKKFVDLFREQIEQELKNKEISENYNERLNSIEKRISSDISLKAIEVIALKKN